jgi:hypothetical protein
LEEINLGIFNSIKKIFTSPKPTESRKTTKTNPMKDKVPIKKTEYYRFIKKNKFKEIESVSLSSKTKESSLDSFFSVSKENPKLIGFEKRSRRKFRDLFHSDNLIVSEASGVIEIVTKDKVVQISLKETPLEKMRCITANESGIILQDKEKIAFLNIKTNQSFLYTFDWQAFSFAMGNEFWLVGTRETYEGPGELYCFDLAGNLNWGIFFQEKFDTVYGELTFMPYILEVSIDSTDIFVGSMDRLYRLDVAGILQARIAISNLKERELHQKHKELQRSLATPPKTEEEAIHMYARELAAQFSMGFERADLTSPFAGFAHDPLMDMMFLFEEKGRVSCWNNNGKLVWINTFKNEGRHISWVDEKLVISFNTGETFWLNREGEFMYGAKLPKQATTISMIPSQNKYLIICEDNRLYELDKESGKLITGSEGHPGMNLFTFSSRNVFFDGKTNTQGYFWLAPTNHQWQHFEAKNFMEKPNGDNIHSGVAPEIAASKKFEEKWRLKSEEKWFGSRVVDVENQRFYVVEKGPEKPIEVMMGLSEDERRKDWTSHYLVCYDFNGNLIWKNHIYSSMWSLYLSPDGETLFTSMPSEDEITYLPGYILTYSKDGKLTGEFKVNAHGFNLEFTSDSKAIVNFAYERGEPPYKGVFERNQIGKWLLKTGEANEYTFGAGLNEMVLPTFKLKRMDKKQYLLSTKNHQVELKLSAAIYEAYETTDSKLLIRTGRRLVSFYNNQLVKVMEIKEQENIQSVCLGRNSLVILTKNEIRGFNYDGELKWRYSSIPKSHDPNVTWHPGKNSYLWIVSNNLETIVASISEDGTVSRSQSFDTNEYHRQIIAYPEFHAFLAQTNELISIYSI